MAQPQPLQLPQPRHHEIEISVDGNGNFTYRPTHLRAKPNDTITFKTNPAGLPFEVMFKHRTPGGKTHIHDRSAEDEGGADNPAGGPPTPPGHLKCGNDLGLYKYAAAVYSGGRVFIDSGCGDVDVGGG